MSVAFRARLGVAGGKKPSSGLNILYVRDGNAQSTITDHLEAEGHTVTSANAFSQTPADFTISNYDVIIIAHSAPNIPLFAAEAKPILSWIAGDTFVNMEFGGSGSQTGTSRVDISDPTHPLAGGLAAGLHTLFSASVDCNFLQDWAAAADYVNVGYHPGNNDYSLGGKRKTDGHRACNIPGANDGHSNLDANGKFFQILDAALDWVIG